MNLFNSFLQTLKEALAQGKNALEINVDPVEVDCGWLIPQQAIFWARFTNQSQERTRLRFMRFRGEFEYSNNDSWESVRMPLKGNAKLSVLLPKTSITEIVSKIPDLLSKRWSVQPISLSLPVLKQTAISSDAPDKFVFELTPNKQCAAHNWKQLPTKAEVNADKPFLLVLEAGGRIVLLFYVQDVSP